MLAMTHETQDFSSQNGLSPDTAPRSIPVTVRTSAGMDKPFRVYDLSRGGCMFDRGMWGVREGQRVWISFAAVANIRATVAWIEDEMVGLVFDDVLHEAIYDHLRRPLCD